MGWPVLNALKQFEQVRSAGFHKTHAREALNFNISLVVYMAMTFLLSRLMTEALRAKKPDGGPCGNRFVLGSDAIQPFVAFWHGYFLQLARRSPACNIYLKDTAAEFEFKAKADFREEQVQRRSRSWRRVRL